MPDLSNIVVKDMREYGVEQAGTYKGGIEAYKGLLNKVRSGSILSEQDSMRLLPKTEETRIRIQKQIEGLLEKYYEIKGKADEIHNSRDITKGLVPVKQSEINLLKNQLDEINAHRSPGQPVQYANFSFGTFLFLLFLLVALSFYLLYFYMSVADFALNGVDPMTLFQEGRLNIQLLPSLRRLVYLIINYPPPDRIPHYFLCPGNIHSPVLGTRHEIQESCLGIAKPGFRRRHFTCSTGSYRCERDPDQVKPG